MIVNKSSVSPSFSPDYESALPNIAAEIRPQNSLSNTGLVHPGRQSQKRLIAAYFGQKDHSAHLNKAQQAILAKNTPVTEAEIDAADEAALHEAIERSLNDKQDAFLSHLKTQSSTEQAQARRLPLHELSSPEQDSDQSIAAGSVSERGAVPMPESMVEIDNRHLQQATQLAQGYGNSIIARALSDYNLACISNDGKVDDQTNSCFFISTLQHVMPDVEVFKFLGTDGAYKRSGSGPITSDSKEAKDFIAELNLNLCKESQSPLHVQIISHDGVNLHADSLGATNNPTARKVLIWDKGGHFEAIQSSEH